MGVQLRLIFIGCLYKMPVPFHTLSCLIFPASLWGKYFYDPHLTREDVEATEAKKFAQGHKEHSWDWNPAIFHLSLCPKPLTWDTGQAQWLKLYVISSVWQLGSEAFLKPPSQLYRWVVQCPLLSFLCFSDTRHTLSTHHQQFMVAKGPLSIPPTPRFFPGSTRPNTISW